MISCTNKVADYICKYEKKADGLLQNKLPNKGNGVGWGNVNLYYRERKTILLLLHNKIKIRLHQQTASC